MDDNQLLLGTVNKKTAQRCTLHNDNQNPIIRLSRAASPSPTALSPTESRGFRSTRPGIPLLKCTGLKSDQEVVTEDRFRVVWPPTLMMLSPRAGRELNAERAFIGYTSNPITSYVVKFRERRNKLKSSRTRKSLFYASVEV
ncbi:hypothetical protein J6590_026715 [Homalodisca vitripennis]|nr:hypothetical protein J6590_026715 [Homalodisca vitripennis]